MKSARNPRVSCEGTAPDQQQNRCMASGRSMEGGRALLASLPPHPPLRGRLRARAPNAQPKEKRSCPQLLGENAVMGGVLAA